MEALIKPEFGLTFWTITCFVLLVLVLSKTAWKPLLKAVEDRESALKRDLEAAESARAEAEKIKKELEIKFAEIKTEISRHLDSAIAEGEKEKERIIEEAHRSAALIVAAARKETDSQKNAVVRELREKVVGLALAVSEKLIEKHLDPKTNSQLIAKSIDELEKANKSFNLSEN
ncbi:MAG: F0F1 ATP synthase subunit B [Elusimicrobia bacterium]|nr:F0F1 ATP synthase subunit B [Elusimicrobiota bacterium]